MEDGAAWGRAEWSGAGWGGVGWAVESAMSGMQRDGLDLDEVAQTYKTAEHLPEPLPDDPFPILRAWFDDAHERRLTANPNAMTLATVALTPQGPRPEARIVLCKALEPRRGVLTFYTNYRGPKARQLGETPYACCVFHWDAAQRQVRVCGPVLPAPAAESDAYFAGRPWQSRVGAHASDQSEPIPSREALLAKVEQTIERFGVDLEGLERGTAPDPAIPRPAHWGGFRVWAERVELWSGGTGRVHDRAEWARTLARRAPEATEACDEFEPGPWRGTRLQP